MADNRILKFGDICQEFKQTCKDPIREGYERYIGLEHLDSSSLKIKRWGFIADDKPSFTRVFKKGQILFGKRRSYLKKAAIATFDGVCSGDIIVMEPKGDVVLPALLPFIVQSEGFWDWAIRTSSGSLSPRTKFSALAEFTIQIPLNQDKQKKLLAIVEKAWMSVQASEFFHESCKTLDRVISDKWFGTANKTLSYVSLSTLTNKHGLQTGPFGSQLHANEYSEQGISVLMPKDISFGDVDIKNAAKVPVEVATKLGRHKLKEGDFIFGRRGEIGRFGYISKELEGALCGTGCLRFRPKNIKDVAFFKAFFRSSAAVNWLNNNAVGMTMLNLNTKILAALPVPDFTESERFRIGTSFEILNSQVTLGIKHVCKNKSLMNAIINLGPMNV
jgi:type I restriction enzyme S subunit